MTYILLIVLTLSSPEQKSKDIKLRIPYSNKEECLKASKKIDLSLKFSRKEFRTKSECISKDTSQRNENIEI